VITSAITMPENKLTPPIVSMIEVAYNPTELKEYSTELAERFYEIMSEALWARVRCNVIIKYSSRSTSYIIIQWYIYKCVCVGILKVNPRLATVSKNLRNRFDFKYDFVC